MKKIIVVVLINLFSVLYAEGLWEKYLDRMGQYSLPAIDEKLLLDILKTKYNSHIDISGDMDNLLLDPGLLTLIENGFNDEEEIIRKSVVIFIANHKIEGFSKKIVEQFPKIKTKTDKKLFLWTFGEVGESSEILAVLEYMKNESDSYLLNLLTVSISKICKKDGTITPLLLLAENSNNYYIKSTAILGLGKLGDKRALDLLWNFATKSQSKEIRYCAILALSTVMNNDPDLNTRLEILLGQFQVSQSIFEKLAISYSVQKITGFNENYYIFMLSFLKQPGFNEVTMDLLEDLPFRQAKDRLETVVLNYPQGIMKNRITQLVGKLKGIK
jgi:hypothetical protein